MTITNEAKLRELLNLKYISADELKSITKKIYTDIEYAIEISNDMEFVEYAQHKFNMIKDCIEENDELNNNMVDENHYLNYSRRNAELLLNEMIRQESKINSLSSTFENYVNENNSVYSDLLYIRYLLLLFNYSDHYISDEEALELMEACSKVYSAEPENVLCKKLYEELTETMRKKFGNTLRNIFDSKNKNNNRINNLQGMIDRERYS